MWKNKDDAGTPPSFQRNISTYREAVEEFSSNAAEFLKCVPSLLDRSRKELGSHERSRRQHNSLRRCSRRLGCRAERTDSNVRRHCAGRDGAFAKEVIHPRDHEERGD
jgi:hypothetical protein